jgi:hypothetical protein
MENSRKNNLLQIADYLVGIAHREYNPEKANKTQYFHQLQHQCKKIIIRPS